EIPQRFGPIRGGDAMSSPDTAKGLQIPTTVIAVVALVTGFLAVSNPTNTSGQPGTARAAGAGTGGPKATAAPSPVPAIGPDDPRRPFEEFWRLAPDDAGAVLAKDLIEHDKLIDPQFLIATVPDPIDSRVAYRFDAIVDDIQMAIESLGWNLDRYWLPWWPSGTQPGRHDSLGPVFDPAPGPGKGFEVKLPLLGGAILSGRYDESTSAEPSRSDATSPLHEREPGILVFRRPRHPELGDTATTQQILIVFLIGERPTSGVHKAALGQAINVID